MSDLSTHLVEADRALVVLDMPRFEGALDQAIGALDCVTEPIPPALAALLHRSIGIRAFSQRREDAVSSFAAARRADPALTLPEDIFPPRSPVSDAWGAIPLGVLPLEPLPEPADGWLLVDGERASARRAALPALLQWQDSEGQIGLTSYLDPGEPASGYPVAKESVHPARRPWLAAATIGTGLLTIGSWSVAAAGHRRYLDLERPVSDESLDGLRARTNTLALTGAGSAGVCVVAGLLLALSG